ncbi:MAG: hypothetical protein ACXACR_14620 [Candidatus Hodarchaeales archaeon]|jgi:hypothetical protein
MSFDTRYFLSWKKKIDKYLLLYIDKTSSSLEYVTLEDMRQLWESRAEPIEAVKIIIDKEIKGDKTK